MNCRSLNRAAAAFGIAVAIAACNRAPSQPELQTSSGVQPRMESITVAGCLKAGLAENTFVLTTPQVGVDSETATYQLIGPTVNLRDYVGQQVEVAGMLRAEQQVASSGVDVVDEPAKGTTGTPVIETKTELNVKHMTVSSVSGTGQRCAE